MGLGRFGGGIGVTRWLVGQGAKVTVTDKDSAASLRGSVEQLAGLEVSYRLGGHQDEDLDGCDLLVVSPAVNKAKSDFVQNALARGIPISSEMNLFVERCPARRIVGITGSAGKSTTTAMLGSIAAACARAGRVPAVWMGGNIGHSPLNDLPHERG
jgi:UDP-N-acetylmuramoylalanine--D-glutamate ligase